MVLLGALGAHPQEHMFANPPMLASHDGHRHVDLVAAPATYTIEGHQFQGMLLQRRVHAAGLALALGRQADCDSSQQARTGKGSTLRRLRMGITSLGSSAPVKLLITRSGQSCSRS